MGVVCFQRIEKAKLPSITNGQVLLAVTHVSRRKKDATFFLSADFERK